MAKKTHRGGKRAGSGRKRLSSDSPSRMIGVTLPESILPHLAAHDPSGKGSPGVGARDLLMWIATAFDQHNLDSSARDDALRQLDRQTRYLVLLHSRVGAAIDEIKEARRDLSKFAAELIFQDFTLPDAPDLTKHADGNVKPK